jgi:hypothetical protein
MINHARTLLLNTNSDNYAPGTLGEEYIPTYQPVELPAYLKTAHRILFGTDPDRVFLNYRANELMRMLHQTEFAEFIYALDPRVTYWPQNQTEFFTPQRQVITQKISGNYETKLHIIGRPLPDNVTGRAYREYTVTVRGAIGSETVTIVSATTNERVEVPLAWLKDQQPVLRLQAGDPGTRGLSAPVDLFDGFLKAQIADAPALPAQLLLEEQDPILGENYLAAPFDLEPGVDPNPVSQFRRMAITGSDIVSMWRLLVYAKPDSALTVCMPRLEFLGEPFYLALFGVENNVEPFATFKNIWADHPNNVYRFSAFVTAMVYRINELHRQNNE